MLGEARGGKVRPESSPELVGDSGGVGRNSAAWGRAWVRRQRGKREEMLAFKCAWSQRGITAAITRI